MDNGQIIDVEESLATTGFSSILGYIQEISSIEEIVQYIKKVDALKVALEAVDTFRTQSVLYAKLEAEALIKACELGGEAQIPARHKQTASWIFNLSKSDREKYIAMCEDGLTIDQVYKREVGNAKKLNEQIAIVEQMRSDLIYDRKKNGIVDMKPFSEKIRETFNGSKRNIGNDIIDGTRNRLRSAGAVGIGDDTGIYVMPCKENSEEVKQAILMRYQSIKNDYESIKQIAKASGVKISYTEFDDGSHWTYNNHNYIMNILMALIDMNVISEAQECIAAIDRTEFSKEVSYINKMYGIARKDYIKKQYEKYVERGEI